MRATLGARSAKALHAGSPSRETVCTRCPPRADAQRREAGSRLPTDQDAGRQATVSEGRLCPIAKPGDDRTAL